SAVGVASGATPARYVSTLISPVIRVLAATRILLANSKVNDFNTTDVADAMRCRLGNVNSSVKIIPSSRRLRCHYSRYLSMSSLNKQRVLLVPHSTRATYV